MAVINSCRFVFVSLSQKVLFKQYPTICHQNSRQFSKYIREFVARRRKPNVSVINLCGIIQADMSRSQLGGTKKLNLDSLYKVIDKAFATKRLREVCLVVNSPGGSPVQSELIANRIMHLSRTKKVDVVSFVEDWAASGGYWLACAGKEIYVTENSITGSIGVIAATFGLQNFIKRYDIERRVKSVGKNKLIWDVFQDEKPEDAEIIQETLNKIYFNFTRYVKKQRGIRLKLEDDDIFSGKYWVGEDAVHLGLVDGVKTLNDYLYEKYGDDVNVVRVNSGKPGFGAIFRNSLFSLEDIENSSAYGKYKFM